MPSGCHSSRNEPHDLCDYFNSCSDSPDVSSSKVTASSSSTEDSSLAAASSTQILKTSSTGGVSAASHTDYMILAATSSIIVRVQTHMDSSTSCAGTETQTTTPTRAISAGSGSSVSTGEIGSTVIRGTAPAATTSVSDAWMVDAGKFRFLIGPAVLFVTIEMY